ncbi:type II secretion system F family protein [Candidatus Woesearchaeota archaeon]|nr:type II secretion system F family protein [Candidatus Woesearchaeota archaeon]
MEQVIDKKELFELKKQLDIYKDYKEKGLKKLEILKRANDTESLKKFLVGRTEEEWKKYYDDFILKLEEKIKTEESQNSIQITNEAIFFLDKKTKEKFIQDTNTENYVLRRIKKKINKKEEIKEEIAYTVYKPTAFGTTANLFVENLTLYLTKQHPKLFNDLSLLLRLGDIKMLSKTYISIALFSSILAGIGSFLLFLLYVAASGGNILLGLIKAVPISFLVLLITPALFYFYPYTTIGNRKKAIKNDLPFVIIHMAAIAGSGALPASIFNLILNSGEYKGLEGEIRKIVNYVNLFGYDLSTALKAVSLTTPSPEFKDLLTGIIATTEGGGDLRAYLSGKAVDALSTYRLERKKYVESLATYSDMYTGILIAAPLLFMTTLAIINVIGGSIGGLSVKTISIAGTYLIIPFLNIIFLVFLSIIQPET